MVLLMPDRYYVNRSHFVGSRRSRGDISVYHQQMVSDSVILERAMQDHARKHHNDIPLVIPLIVSVWTTCWCLTLDFNTDVILEGPNQNSDSVCYQTVARGSERRCVSTCEIFSFYSLTYLHFLISQRNLLILATMTI